MNDVNGASWALERKVVEGVTNTVKIRSQEKEEGSKTVAPKLATFPTTKWHGQY